MSPPLSDLRRLQVVCCTRWDEWWVLVALSKFYSFSFMTSCSSKGFQPIAVPFSLSDFFEWLVWAASSNLSGYYSSSWLMANNCDGMSQDLAWNFTLFWKFKYITVRLSIKHRCKCSRTHFTILHFRSNYWYQYFGLTRRNCYQYFCLLDSIWIEWQHCKSMYFMEWIRSCLSIMEPLGLHSRW